MSGAATVHGWADDLRAFADDWPAEGARTTAEAIDRVVRADTGGDGRLSNLRDGDAGVDVTSQPRDASVEASGGAWAILEFGTSRHFVRPNQRRAVLTPAGPRRFAQVAGMRARQTWSKGSAAGLVAAARSADAAWEAII